MPPQVPLTRAQMRDRIRRNLQLFPLTDISGLTSDQGAAYSVQPYPHDALLNQCLNEAVDAVNSIVRVAPVTVVTVTVPASTQPGPAYVDFSPSLLDLADVSEALNVDWQPTSPANAKLLRLEPYDYYAPTRVYVPLDPLPPAPHPDQWFQIGSQIGLTPPPNQAGTLYVTQQEGLTYPVTDADTLDTFLPTTYHRAIYFLATAFVCNIQTSDVEMAGRGQWFYAQGMAIVQQIYDWKNGYGVGSMEAQRDTLQMIPGMNRLTPMRQGPQRPDNQQGGR